MVLNNKTKFLEGSRAISLTVSNISPEVVSAYPITPQTHIVEDLAQLKAEGKADFEYLRAESEFAAASIIVGAAAAGSRVYSATSSQGLILMMEVLYNAAGLRLPLVMTVANRAVGAPINIWNDHSDAMAMRDAGWMMLFAENHQEAVDLHVIAYKLAESYNLPVAINVDGFILTHSYENVIIPDKKTIKKYLPTYKPAPGTYLNPQKPITLGGFFTPEHYWREKKKLDEDLKKTGASLSRAYREWKKILPSPLSVKPIFDNGLIEYCGPKNPKTILITMGSVAGTIKEVLKKEKNSGLLKIRSYRPFPAQDIKRIIKNCPRLAVLEKASSAGAYGPLYSDVMSSLPQYQGLSSDHIIGLGGRDISTAIIKNIIKSAGKAGLKFW
ncbi:MAG TPA: pyruvate ferredoxin oxidoreductase [bacterium]|nr:pyruvate ferredoxin oxidoreductase [bacterium]HPY99583.1 pyruvate ferredoxin oxidoreductase [bacterium]HQB76134.1 pyruvate ferredoxin oxidoreductase [bacterium]